MNETEKNLDTIDNINSFHKVSKQEGEEIMHQQQRFGRMSRDHAVIISGANIQSQILEKETDEHGS